MISSTERPYNESETIYSYISINLSNQIHTLIHTYHACQADLNQLRETVFQNISHISDLSTATL